MYVHHFTDRAGHNAIRSQPVWLFKAGEQRATHLPFGAYFTPLWANHPTFYQRTRIPTGKREYHFSFQDVGDLTPLRGDRGRSVLYSPVDYAVAEEGRGRTHGPADPSRPGPGTDGAAGSGAA